MVIRIAAKAAAKALRRATFEIKAAKALRRAARGVERGRVGALRGAIGAERGRVAAQKPGIYIKGKLVPQTKAEKARGLQYYKDLEAMRATGRTLSLPKSYFRAIARSNARISSLVKQGKKASQKTKGKRVHTFPGPGMMQKRKVPIQLETFGKALPKNLHRPTAPKTFSIKGWKVVKGKKIKSAKKVK